MRALAEARVLWGEAPSWLRIASVLAAVGFAVGLLFEQTLWNLLTELWGVAGGGLVVWALLEHQRRSRLRALEHDVLDAALVHTMAVVRSVGIFGEVAELAPGISEDDTQMNARVQTFAKTTVRNGLAIRPEKLRSTHELALFSRQLDDLLENIFELQHTYPFVFVAYPAIAKLAMRLGGARAAVKSAF